MRIDFLSITLFLISALTLNWLCVFFKWTKHERIFKPLATISIIIWTLAAADWKIESALLLLLVGQILSLVGDIFLLFKTKYFLMGLVSFLIAHLIYIIILLWGLVPNVGYSFLLKERIGGLFLFGMVWVGMLVFFNCFILPKDSKLIMKLKLWTFAQLYGWVLSFVFLLASLAVLSKPVCSPTYFFLPFGALLFFVSDSILAYDRFNKKIPKVRNLVRPTYHLAQLSLAWGFLNYLDLL